MLEVSELTVRYGRFTAVPQLDIEVDPGQIVGLIGPNGAGKTSSIDAITGFAPCEGSIMFDGREISGLSAHRRARLGLARTWQSLELFHDLTVRDNLRIASDHDTLLSAVRSFGRRPSATPDAVDGALDALGIIELADRFPTEISQGQRKLVSAARALAARPRIVCMDEPAAGLDSGESHALGVRLRRLIDGGLGILLFDHDMGLVLEVCDHIVVMDFGQVIASGTPAEIRTDQAVLDAYLGTAAGEERS